MANEKKPQTAAEYARAKVKLKERLNREGRWIAFVQERKRLKMEMRFPDFINWVCAAMKFPPLDGSPPEFTAEDERRRLGQISAEILPKTRGRALTDEEVYELKLKAVSNAQSRKTTTRRETEWENLRRKVVSNERKKTWKRPTVAECVIWAWEMANTPPSEIEAGEVPSRAALRLLIEVSDKGFYTEVTKTIMSKYASKDDEVSERGIRDDNRKHLVLMEKIDDIDTELLDEVELAQLLAEQEAADMEESPELTDEEELGIDESEEIVIPPADFERDPSDEEAEEGGDADPAQ